jgi:hypothetical protein
MPGLLPAERQRRYRRNKNIGYLTMPTLQDFLILAFGILITFIALGTSALLVFVIVKKVSEWFELF